MSQPWGPSPVRKAGPVGPPEQRFHVVLRVSNITPGASLSLVMQAMQSLFESDTYAGANNPEGPQVDFNYELIGVNSAGMDLPLGGV
jgi:hypothetical protein